MNNNISFTSVIPVKVIANGVESTDAELVRKTCNCVIRSFAGPLKNNPNPVINNAAAKLSTMDPDYNHYLAYSRGYREYFGGINSDYFKAILDKNNRGYIVTGAPVRKFFEIGHEIGSAKKECSNNGIKLSERLQNAYNRYTQLIRDTGRDMNLRIREVFNHITKQKEGKFQQMEVYVTTKNVKRAGNLKPEVKSIDNIIFSEHPNFTKTS